MSSVTPGNARVRLVVTLVSVAAIVACVVLLTLLATRSSKTDAQALADDRSAASSAANTFVTALGTYDKAMLRGTTMPVYRANVEAVLTPKFAVAFESEGAPKAEQAVAVAGLKESVRIWSTGVVAISADQATLVVVGSLTDSVPKTPGKTDYRSLGETPFRTIITLNKIGGKWLVDGQTPVEGIPPMASSVPSGTPTPTPTSGATK